MWTRELHGKNYHNHGKLMLFRRIGDRKGITFFVKGMRGDGDNPYETRGDRLHRGGVGMGTDSTGIEWG